VRGSMSLKLENAPLDAFMDALKRARRRVWLASPFIGSGVGVLVGEVLDNRRAAHPDLELRGLTNLSLGALQGGFSSVDGLVALLAAGVELRAVSNLHAKVLIVDDFFVLVGSNNLTAGGMAADNVELGVVSRRGADVSNVAAVFDDWWRQTTREKHGFTERTLASVPRGTTRRARVGQESLAGSRLPTHSSETYATFAADERRKSALIALTEGLVPPSRPLPGARVQRMGRPPGPAWRSVHRLRDAPPRSRDDVRGALLEVLARHRDPEARAHAAWRLAHDDLLVARHRTIIGAALDIQSASDPSNVVRRACTRARRALAIGGVSRKS
jgi:hypothetical protein